MTIKTSHQAKCGKRQLPSELIIRISTSDNKRTPGEEYYRILPYTGIYVYANTVGDEPSLPFIRSASISRKKMAGEKLCTNFHLLNRLKNM